MKAYAQKQSEPHQQSSHDGKRSRAKPRAASNAVHQILYLQSTIGNHAVQRLLAAHTTNERHSTTIGSDQDSNPTPVDGKHVQTKGIGSSDSGLTAAPSIIHEALASPGQPLSAETRAVMEPRFGQNFSGVRVHTDPVAVRSANAVAAQAYTVGSDIVFGAGRYAPASRDGQRLLAHELAHVQQQQQSGLALQRQSLLGQSPTIPTELRTSANIGKMTDQELAERHDRILKVLDQFNMSTPDTALLEREAARIGVELARRKALAEGRTFTEESIQKVKAYLTANSQKPKKPKVNPPPAPAGGWRDECNIAVNKGLKIVTGEPALPTSHETIESSMALVVASGHSSAAREVLFEGPGGRVSRSGALRPEKLQTSIWDTVMSLTGGDPGWSVFTMSLLDGYHSVTLTLDASDPSAPHLYWADQWPEKGGWKEYTHSELDAEVTSLVQGWWDGQPQGRKHNTVVRVWRITATAATSTSGP